MVSLQGAGKLELRGRPKMKFFFAFGIFVFFFFLPFLEVFLCFKIFKHPEASGAVQHDFCLDDLSSTFEDVFPIQKVGFPIAMFDSITNGEKTPEKPKPENKIFCLASVIMCFLVCPSCDVFHGFQNRGLFGVVLAGDWKETKEVGLSQHKRRETLVVKNRNCGAIPAVFLSNPQDPCMVYLPTNLPQKSTIHLGKYT